MSGEDEARKKLIEVESMGFLMLELIPGRGLKFAFITTFHYLPSKGSP